MNTTEAIAAVRLSALAGVQHPDYTDTRIKQELTDTLQSVFGHIIVQSKSGAWLKRYETTTQTGKTRYRMPARAQSIDTIELVENFGTYQVEGDQIVFDVEPNAGLTLRFTYYVRPSLLVTPQTDGEITAVDTDLLTVTVNVVPDDQVLGGAIQSGEKIDIVHPDGWHELAVVGATASLASTTFTLPAGTDMSDIEVGDFVRAAGQTDWPSLEDSFHRLLCDVTSARIAKARGDFERAERLERQSMGEDPQANPGGDLARFRDSLCPRVKKTVETCVQRFGVLGTFNKPLVRTRTSV